MSTYCPLCGQKIIGSGRSFSHPNWAPEVHLVVCDSCARNCSRCRDCGLPLPGAPVSDPGLCVTCRRARQICLACGRAIQNKGYYFDENGPYCVDCRRSQPPCDGCGAPLSYEHWQLSDGRMICAVCHLTAVYLPDAAAALYAELKKFLADELGLTLNIPTGLALVDRDGLRTVIDQQTAAQQGAVSASNDPSTRVLVAEHTLGLYARRGMRRGIYIQTGLPRLLFLQVAAHEFGHAWQGENCPLLSDALIHEGFAEWVAYMTALHYGDRHGQERMRVRQDLYGEGLRWALDVAAHRGQEGLFQACRLSSRTG